MKKTILVTGGLGFIGSNFINLYYKHSNKDFGIVNLDKCTYASDIRNSKEFMNNRNYSFIKGDICNKELVEYIFEKYEIVDVINFAAESHVDNSIANPSIFIKSNVEGVVSLLEVCRKYWKSDYSKHRFLQISTDEVLGSMPLNSNYKWKENDVLNPRSPYSASKASAEHLCMSYYSTYGLPVIITRSSNNFGPRQNKEKLIPKVISSLKEKYKIPVYGKGDNIRDWIYVDDNCKALNLVLQRGKVGNIYNIGANNEMTNLNLIKVMISLYCSLYNLKENQYRKLISFVEDRLGHDLKYSICTDKIRDLGWIVPKRNVLGENLINTISWYHGV